MLARPKLLVLDVFGITQCIYEKNQHWWPTRPTDWLILGYRDWHWQTLASYWFTCNPRRLLHRKISKVLDGCLELSFAGSGFLINSLDSCLSTAGVKHFACAHGLHSISSYILAFACHLFFWLHKRHNDYWFVGFTEHWHGDWRHGWWKIASRLSRRNAKEKD